MAQEVAWPILLARGGVTEELIVRSISVEIDLIDTRLLSGSRPSVPGVLAPLHPRELLHSQTAPARHLANHTVAGSPELVAKNTQPSRLSAQHVRTQQSLLLFVDCRQRLSPFDRQPQQLINFVVRANCRLWSHLSSGYAPVHPVATAYESPASKIVPQQLQDPVALTSHGWIALRICSHVTPKVFFGAEVLNEDE